MENNKLSRKFYDAYAFQGSGKADTVDNRTLKYFIEDTDTGLWYRNTLGEHPEVHTYGKGWDKPDLEEKDYWTNDPEQALSVFKDKEHAESWLAELLDKKYFWFQNPDYSMKKLIVTEHEFVKGNPSDNADPQPTVDNTEQGREKKRLEKECTAALSCLYLEAPSSVADAVRQKVMAYIIYLEHNHAKDEQLYRFVKASERLPKTSGLYFIKEDSFKGIFLFDNHTNTWTKGDRKQTISEWLEPITRKGKDKEAAASQFNNPPLEGKEGKYYTLEQLEQSHNNYAAYVLENPGDKSAKELFKEYWEKK